MLNFIKYEWLRRWKFFLAGILVFIAVNVDLISRMISKMSPNFISVILVALLFALCVALVLDHIGRMYRSLYTDEGFMEFTLPLNGYQMLGAKLLAVVLECAAVMIIVGLVTYVDLMYMEKTIIDLQLPQFTWEIFLNILQVTGLALAGYITFMLMVYLSLALAKSLFASFKHGMLIAFGCFLVLGKILELLGDLVNINAGYSTHGPHVMVETTGWLVSAVLIGILFAGTAYLLDRKINL